MNWKTVVIILIGSFIESALAVPSTQLTLVKEVIDGEATATDWVLTANGAGANDLSGAGWASGPVIPDTFDLSESVGPPGYTAGDWDCVGGGILNGQSLTLSVGDDVTCTIINTYLPSIVIFETDFALPVMPIGDGTGTPVCVDVASGLLVAGCDVTITADQIDPTTVQKRVDGTCAVGNSMRAVESGGGVVCEPDIDTTLSEGEVDAFVANNDYSTGPHAYAIFETSEDDATTFLTNGCANHPPGNITINVPGSGTVVVNGNVWTRISHTTGTKDETILVFATASGSGCTDWADVSIVSIPSSYPTSSGDIDHVKVRRVFSVSGAGDKTFYLNARMSSGFSANTDNLWWTRTDATFYPDPP